MDNPKLMGLEVGMKVIAGDRLLTVSAALAQRFAPGDRLLAVPISDQLLHVPAEEHELVDAAVTRARGAFRDLAAVSDDAIAAFYSAFAAALDDDAVWANIRQANDADVARAVARQRSVTRLAVSDKMRGDMAVGLRAWRALPPRRGLVVDTITHDGWALQQVTDGLGVVGFVFEGRPNVFADAAGLLRSGNTVVMRIGSDALETAKAISAHALEPALAAAGLPDGAVVLVKSASRAAGWALFAHPGLSLAVARGSGPAVSLLGAIARQAGTPASLHGTGGAWIVADTAADTERFRAALYYSLDRKVCNTVNTVCIVRERAADLVPALLEALERRIPALSGTSIGAGTGAGTGTGTGIGTLEDKAPLGYKLHVTPAARTYVPAALFQRTATMLRAEGPVEEPMAVEIEAGALGDEWEWEYTPEVTLSVVEHTTEAIELFNAQSPLFAASLISEDAAAHEAFFRAVNAPFVCDGFTRWVDGQYALGLPELGLSNWRNGRLFARGAILSGDGVYTMRYRAIQRDPQVHR